MRSVIKQRIRQRVAGVYDLAHGAQGTVKVVNEYVRQLEKAGNVKDRVGDQSDFLKDFGGGI